MGRGARAQASGRGMRVKGGGAEAWLGRTGGSVIWPTRRRQFCELMACRWIFFEERATRAAPARAWACCAASPNSSSKFETRLLVGPDCKASERRSP